jgi:hypothetical protein
VLPEEITKPGISGAVIQVADIDLEHDKAFPSRRLGPARGTDGAFASQFGTRCPGPRRSYQSPPNDRRPESGLPVAAASQEAGARHPRPDWRGLTARMGAATWDGP